MSRGGYRWGRPRVSVEQCHSLSAWGRFQGVQRRGYEDPDLKGKHYTKDGYLVIDYSRDGLKLSERIRLTETPCHFGGSRSWLVCPNCGRRVGKVYLPTNLYSGGQRVQSWLCRHCYKLSYEQRRARGGLELSEVLGQRADRLLDRSGITIDKRGYYRRPRGMRRKTFERLVAEHRDIEARLRRADWQTDKTLFRLLGSYGSIKYPTARHKKTLDRGGNSL